MFFRSIYAKPLIRNLFSVFVQKKRKQKKQRLILRGVNDISNHTDKSPSDLLNQFFYRHHRTYPIQQRKKDGKSYLEFFSCVTMCHECHDPDKYTDCTKLDSATKSTNINGLGVITTYINSPHKERIQPIPKIDTFNIETREFRAASQPTEEIDQISSCMDGHRKLRDIILDIAMLSSALFFPNVQYTIGFSFEISAKVVSFPN
jgi:hypothetical protein